MGRELCQSRGWRVTYLLRDPGEGGEDFERPMYQRAFDLADRHAIDVLIVWKIDRIARSLAQSAVLEEMLHQNSVGIVSLTEPIDTTTPSGRFIFGIMAGAAQLENDIRRERIRLGMRRLANQGKWGRSRVPFGFRRKPSLRLAKNIGEEQALRLVFQTYRRTQSLTETAHRLNSKGITHRGSAWTVAHVKRALHNPIAAGILRASGIETHHVKLQIISVREYERTLALLTQRHRSGKPVSRAARAASIKNVFAQYFESLRRENLAEADSLLAAGDPAGGAGLLLSRERAEKERKMRMGRRPRSLRTTPLVGPARTIP